MRIAHRLAKEPTRVEENRRGEKNYGSKSDQHLYATLIVCQVEADGLRLSSEFNLEVAGALKRER